MLLPNSATDTANMMAQAFVMYKNLVNKNLGSSASGEPLETTFGITGDVRGDAASERTGDESSKTSRKASDYHLEKPVGFSLQSPRNSD